MTKKELLEWINIKLKAEGNIYWKSKWMNGQHKGRVEILEEIKEKYYK